MSIVSQNNGLLAEFAVFPVETENQVRLVEQVIPTIESTLKQHPGFVSGTVFRSRDGLRVTSYIQWADQNSYVATQPLTEFTLSGRRKDESTVNHPKVIATIWMG
jgi:hypothetical protein